MCNVVIRIKIQIKIIIFLISSIYCIFLFFVIIFPFNHAIILVIFCKTSEGIKYIEIVSNPEFFYLQNLKPFFPTWTIYGYVRVPLSLGLRSTVYT